MYFYRGLSMSQIEEKTKKGSMFICPNASCGKVFSKPLKALNLHQDPEGPFDACPYCLTEINMEDEPVATPDEPETFEEEAAEAETEVEKEETTTPTEKHIEISEPPSECQHHIGYLSEKSSKEQIPDECMMCKDIVKCMLKKMKE
jgi:hypothetical protein